MQNTSRNKIKASKIKASKIKASKIKASEIKASEIQQNIDLLKELSSSSICMFEGWSTPIEEAIWYLEDYLLALEHIEKQKEEIYKQNALLGELLSKANEGKA